MPGKTYTHPLITAHHEINRLKAINADLLAALEDIVKGEGPYSRDQLEHCSNTVDSMKETARAAIAKARQ
ncbi:hypothetical protein LCGC14_0960780 [marine sediment metagenome]|uniref:Uncharacterized protein n=1 Tax=marine sediment metagenome TaxID=412755 RepID=A0A0F9P0N8_9ZZZZ